MHLYNFEKLVVWQDSRKFIVHIYKTTLKFPPEEKFGLTSQMRRCAISIASNIAEGSGRTSPKDQAHFFHMAYSSSLELLNQLIIANDLEYISHEALKDCRMSIEKISNKLNSLKKSLFVKPTPSKQLNN